MTDLDRQCLEAFRSLSEADQDFVLSLQSIIIQSRQGAAQEP